MQNGYQGLVRLFLIIAILINAGCNTDRIISPQHGLPVDQMRANVRAGIKSNEVPKKQEPHYVPSSVSKALLPSYSNENGGNLTYRPEKRFDIAAHNIPARDFFMSLIEGTPYNMVVNPKVEGNITLELKKVTINETLEAVRDAYGYEFHRNSYGFEILPAKLETKIFTINYLDVKRKGKSVTEMTSGQITEQVSSTAVGGSAYSPTPIATGGAQSVTSGVSVDTRTDVNFWKMLETSLKQIVGNQNGRSVVVNSQSGVIIIRAFPRELKQVTRYLDRIQTNMNRQVILEAKVLEVQLDSQFQSGIDWNLIGRVASGQGGLGQTSMVAFNNTDLSDFDGIFTLRINGNFGLLIKLLQTQGNVQVLSSPRISTVNNQKAVIKVGQDQFFVTGVSTTSSGTVGSGVGSSFFPSESIDLTPFFSGVTLDVTPQISHDGEIVLHIHPTVSLVKDQEKTIILGNNGINNEPNIFRLPLAQSTIRESDNIVRAKSGQVIVIGGLLQNDMREQVSGVPLLSRIPFIGPFFRRTEQLARKIELVILLRPIIANNKAYSTELKEDNAILGTMRKGFHQGSLPEVFGNEGELEDGGCC
jgi:MSHA biogenesis protein MshL